MLLVAFDLGNVVTTDAPGVHAYFFGVGGSGRRPVSPPTPGSGEWGGKGSMSKAEPKGERLLKRLKKEIVRGGAAVV